MILIMTAAANTPRSNTYIWRLPPDVVSASWSWDCELSYARSWRPGQDSWRFRTVGPIQAYLTCDVKLTDIDDYSDLIVRAEHANGHQTASLSYTARRPRAYPPDFDGSQVLQTCGGFMCCNQCGRRCN